MRGRLECTVAILMGEMLAFLVFHGEDAKRERTAHAGRADNMASLVNAPDALEVGVCAVAKVARRVTTNGLKESMLTVGEGKSF